MLLLSSESFVVTSARSMFLLLLHCRQWRRRGVCIPIGLHSCHHQKDFYVYWREKLLLTGSVKKISRLICYFTHTAIFYGKKKNKTILCIQIPQMQQFLNFLPEENASRTFFLAWGTPTYKHLPDDIYSTLTFHTPILMKSHQPIISALLLQNPP